jgi:hypothetical protein
MTVNYQKRKNTELFKSLETTDSLFLSNTQNYIPIYSRFFNLNETNYNGINLNHQLFISTVKGNHTENKNLFKCGAKNIDNNKVLERNVFFKIAPLLDPYKYLIGKYNHTDPELFNLPLLDSIEQKCNSKILDPNNSAYVDGFFSFLTSILVHKNRFLHGLDYYGSFLGIKNDYKLDVFDDIDYLNSSDFFNKNKNSLFTIDDYQHLFKDNETKLVPLNIDHSSSAKSALSIKSFDETIFEDVFDTNTVSINDNFEDLVDITNSTIIENKDTNHLTLRSGSTCSSRSSYTNDDDLEESSTNDEDEEQEDDKDDEDDEDDEDAEDDEDKGSDKDKGNRKTQSSESCDDSSSIRSSSSSSIEYERIEVTIPKFPVQVIAMEYCENTFDDLILNNDLKDVEWFSAFMQIIMTLIAYQKSFNFTHNDLHTNNVMYTSTDKKFIYYRYKKKHYRVPTFGRLFKIIDFGRSIYKFDGKIFCSDSFQSGGDAATQYNTEPYFNDKKPRLEPNYSFDLCRLACSIYDYVIDDFEEANDLSKCNDPVKRLIIEWCLDDKGINMLYKNNGVDRYPDFKLYKMIARCVHNHTPQAQLERSEFKAFLCANSDVPPNVIDIDALPVYA